MTNVRASADHPHCTAGQAGIVTLWVRAATEESATGHAREILRARPYSFQDELSVYLEETGDSPNPGSTFGLAEELRCSSPAPAGYQMIKDAALKQGDGLFETWFPPEV